MAFNSVLIRAVLDTVTEGIVVQDANGAIIDCNPAAERILGLSRSQMMGKESIDDEWHAIREDGSPFPGEEHPAMVTLRTGKPIKDFVFGVSGSSRIRKWISVTTQPIFDAAGKTVSVLACFVDVTSQREQTKSLQVILEASQLGVWDWDVPTGYVQFNERWAEMLGYDLSEIEPNVRAWEKLIDPESLSIAWKVVQDHFDGLTQEYRNEMQMRHKDGTDRWILAVGQLISRDADNKPKRMAGVHIDITASKLAEFELVEANRLAQAASVSKSEFLANMSHEIRTPMTAILGFTDLLETELEDSPHSEKALDYISTIRRNGASLLQLINDILDISKIEAGKFSVDVVPTEIRPLVEDVVVTMTARANAKRINLLSSFAPAVPRWIQTDPGRLRQILMNLVGNAIKFTDTGSVTIRVGLHHDKCIRFFIEDTGIGMSPEQLSRLFNAFEQGDASITRRYGGTGLGLRISKRLAQMLGGDISVTSQLGKGSVFVICLDMGASASVPNPKSTASSILAGETVAPNARPLEGIQILLAEDGPDNQKLITHILKKAGALVRVVENGLLALQELMTPDGELNSDHSFDLLLCDIQMPEMDGYTVVEKLRERNSVLPVVALTAFAMSDEPAKCIRAGFNAYASKPIDRDMLIAICLKWGRKPQS